MYLVAPDRHATAEFVIRSYMPGDGERLADATNASYDLLRRFMHWARPHQSTAQAERFCRESRGRYLLAQDFALGIFSVDERTLLGGSGFHLRDGGLESATAEIGMWIRQERAGKGLGTRALQTILAWGFSDWPWDRLAWRCSADNFASLAIAEKAGMQSEGLLRSQMLAPDGSRRDTVCFAALRDEWALPDEL
ncbi:MAG: GNAT family N-acetyltransferase [Myxococcales bacterium]|nr:GNAT family N-acetyltransferase [Myxococcales bacterium]